MVALSTKPTSKSAADTIARGSKITAVAKDILLAPIYLYQGHKVKRDTPRLPEPDGARHGQVPLNSPKKARATTDNQPTLNIMIVGDSAAAGVGSLTQTDALAGKLIPALQQKSIINSRFRALNWSLQATTGHTSFDILRRLYVLPTPSASVEVMVVSVGVNDTTSSVSTTQWQQQLQEIISVAKRKFGVQILIFSSLPPMAQMPALPKPLNNFMGAKATKMDNVLQQVCAKYHGNGVHYMATDFQQMANEHANGDAIDNAVMFARDGFHSSPITYGYWAQQLSALIANLLDENNS